MGHVGSEVASDHAVPSWVVPARENAPAAFLDCPDNSMYLNVTMLAIAAVVWAICCRIPLIATAGTGPGILRSTGSSISCAAYVIEAAILAQWLPEACSGDFSVGKLCAPCYLYTGLTQSSGTHPCNCQQQCSATMHEAHFLSNSFLMKAAISWRRLMYAGNGMVTVSTNRQFVYVKLQNQLFFRASTNQSAWESNSPTHLQSVAVAQLLHFTHNIRKRLQSPWPASQEREATLPRTHLKQFTGLVRRLSQTCDF